MVETNQNILGEKAFTEPVVLTGFTYWDSHSRIFNIIRLPAMMKYLYPAIRKRKLQFEIQCFPNKEELRKYLEENNEVPIILNLYSRPEEKI
jgi:hypothetical protein